MMFEKVFDGNDGRLSSRNVSSIRKDLNIVDELLPFLALRIFHDCLYMPEAIQEYHVSVLELGTSCSFLSRLQGYRLSTKCHFVHSENLSHDCRDVDSHAEK